MKWNKWHRHRLQRFSTTMFQSRYLGRSPKKSSFSEHGHLALNEKIADLRILMIAAQAGEHDAYRELLNRIAGILHRHYESRLPALVLERAIRNTILTIHALRHTYDPASSFESWISEIARRRVKDACRPRAGDLALLPT